MVVNKVQHEAVNNLKNNNLVSYLKRSGYQLKRAGSDYIWESSQGKVSIKGNKWYHQYDKEGGYVIGFFQRFFDMTFHQSHPMS